MQKQIEINGRKYLCVVVSKEYVRFGYNPHHRIIRGYTDSDIAYLLTPHLPEGKYKILGTLDTISEEHSKDIVEKIEHLYTINVSPRPYASILNAFIFENGITWNESTETILIIQIN